MTLEILLVGLGEYGTSVALGLVEAGVDARLIGYDHHKQAGKAALEAGAISNLVSNPYKAARSADAVILTLPAGEADDYIHDVAGNLKEEAVLMDGSPLKASSLRWAAENFEGAHYLGMVPVVRHQALFDLNTSYQDARGDLFRDSLFGLVIPADTPERAINIAVNIANALGSKPFFIDAAEMEAVTSLTDTLPAALSLALVQMAAGSKGWPDIQRIAGRSLVATTYNLEASSAAALASKFIENRQSLTVHLDQFIERLSELRQAINDEEQEQLSKAIGQAIRDRQSWLAKRERADWEAEEKKRSQVSSTGLFGNLFGFDPSRGRKSR